MTDYTTHPQDFPWPSGSGSGSTSIQDSIDEGDGITAALQGSLFDVYRWGTASGDMIQTANKVLSGFPVYREKASSADPAFEADVSLGSYFYKLTCDGRPLQVGDVFVEASGIGGKDKVTFDTLQFNGFCLSNRQDLKSRLAARLDRKLRILRPQLAPVGIYANSTIKGALPLICTNGVFSLGAVGSPGALIPAGFMGEKKSSRGMTFPGTPDMPQRSSWKVFVPPIPGFTIKEGDFLLSEEGDRYRVQNPYRQDTGLVGYQLICEREGAQAIA